MSIVICFNNKDPEPWKRALQSKLEDTTVEVYPKVKAPHKVSFALCWKPDNNVLDKFPNTKVVQSAGASVEHIINSQKLPVDCTLTRIVDHQLAEDMFEFVLSVLMMHLKKLSHYQLDENQINWKQRYYIRIKNVTVGVLGLGKIGTYVSKELNRFGFKVKAWSKSEKKIENIRCLHGENGLQKLLHGTDILLNILPLTAETAHILNRQNLGQLNKDGFLINVGRGEHLVDNDLLYLLENNHLSGAALDVFRTEPLPKDHPFWEHDKIRITPHIAALTNIETATEIIATNYKNLLAGKELVNVVSIKKGY